MGDLAYRLIALGVAVGLCCGAVAMFDWKPTPAKAQPRSEAVVYFKLECLPPADGDYTNPNWPPPGCIANAPIP